MKLDKKLDAIQLPALKVGHREAGRAFARAIAEGKIFLDHVRQGTVHYAASCVEFYIARQGFEHGEWQAQCVMYKENVSLRTIERRVAFGEKLIRWAVYNFKDLTDIIEIREKLKFLPLPSVKAIVQEIRDAEIARKFGEYFKDDYQAKKQARLLGQLDFDFKAASATLQLICNPKCALPADLASAEDLAGSLKIAQLRAERHVRDLRASGSARAPRASGRAPAPEPPQKEIETKEAK